MICRVEARPLEDNTHGHINLAESFFIAFRAPGQRGVAEMLLSLKLYTAIFTPVRINRHSKTSITEPIHWYADHTKSDYSALVGD